jgi:signal transduction histidine kinase
VVESEVRNTQPAEAVLLRSILEATAEGIVFVNSDRTIGYINQVAREILRCSRQDVPLPTSTELTNLLGFDPLAIAREDSVYPWQQEVTIFGVPHVVNARPVFSAPPSSGGTVLCFKDIRETERKERTIAENLSFASHELITPITAIKNALDLLSGQRLGDLNDQQSKFIRLASRNVERLNNVVTAVLDLSQLENKSLALHLEKVNLAAPVGLALATLEGLAQEKGVKLKNQLQDEYPLLLADANRLRQAIYNLVHNAIKFTPEGGNVQVSLEVVDSVTLPERIKKTVETQLPRELASESLLLTVADDGLGIPAAHVKAIFAKFHQGKEPSAEQNMRGRGLGLAIVKTVVEAHGGAVWVESEPGEGSIFRVLLPNLSREAYLIRTAEVSLERVKVMGSALTLVILKVMDVTKEVASEPQMEGEMANLLNLVMPVVQNTVRLSSDRVEILDPVRGVFCLLAEISLENAPALLQRVTSNLRKKAEQNAQILNLQLIWGMASYPKNVSTAEELVAAALKTASGTRAKVIQLEQE